VRPRESLGGTATYTTDYSASQAHYSYMNFNSPASTATLTITAVDDSSVEGSESVTLTVQRFQMFPTGPTASDGLSLYDNDTSSPPPPPVVSVATGSDATEGGTHGTFQFTRTGDTTSALTVTYTVQTGGTGDATPGADYEELIGTVTIAAGESSATVAVVAGIDLIDPDEVVAVSVAEATGYSVGANATAEVGIVEDLTDAATLTRVLNRYFDTIDSNLSDLPDDLQAILANMNAAAGTMSAGHEVADAGLYGIAFGVYGLLDLNRGLRLTTLVEKADEIIDAVEAAAAITEGDAFRITGLKALADELRTYLSARLTQVEGLITELEELHDAIVGPGSPEAIVSGLEAFLHNLENTREQLSDRIDRLDDMSYTPGNPSNAPGLAALNQKSVQVNAALDDLEGVVASAGGVIETLSDIATEILTSTDDGHRQALLRHYVFNVLSPFEHGVGETLGLVDQVEEAVDALLDLVAVSPEGAAGSVLDLVDFATDELGVTDSLRLHGIATRLGYAADELRNLIDRLEGLRAQMNEFAAQELLAGYFPIADYWSALQYLNSMIAGVTDQLTRVTSMRTAVLNRIE